VTLADWQALFNECTHCAGQLQHNPPRKRGTRIEPASWQCNHCGRGGLYAQCTSGSGRTFRARVEVVAGLPEFARPWVLAESVPYEERVA
jgi:hypothetical protein